MSVTVFRGDGVSVMITANPNAAFRDVKTNRADHASEIAGSTILSRYAALELRGEKAHPASMIVRSSMLSRILHELFLGSSLHLSWVLASRLPGTHMVAKL